MAANPELSARQRDRVHGWVARPALAVLLRAGAALVPFASALAVTWAAGTWLPARTMGLAGWLWVVLVVLFAVIVLATTTLLAQRLLPLAALLRLDVQFPAPAPSRVRSSLRHVDHHTLDRAVSAADSATKDQWRAQADLVVELLRALHRHDPATLGHSLRVSSYAGLIGDGMELDPVEGAKLRTAALLHDVGKVSVPASVLTKRGAPTPSEWRVLRGHPEAGRKLLAPLESWLGAWVEVAADHHMRWDGGGYRAGEAESAGSLGGRIVAVADAYDVMTSTRSYKAALPRDLARVELCEKVGEQFDPAVVRAFLGVDGVKVREVNGLAGTVMNTVRALQLPMPPSPVMVANGVITAMALASGWGGLF